MVWRVGWSSPEQTLSPLLLAGVLALLAPAAAGQLHKDAVRGFQFKPPKDFKTVALTPNERTVIAKYQDDTTEYSGDAGGAGYRQMFEVSFYPKDGDGAAGVVISGGGALAPDDEDENATPLANVVRMLEVKHGDAGPEKAKSLKLAGGDGQELYFAPSSPLKYYYLVLQQEDGVFVFEGSSLAQRFDKASSEFSKAARSFKRIARADTSSHAAELSQLSEQDRFLQEQVDKLPKGWSSLRTPRYLFLYNAEKSFVKELADRIEAMRNEYERLYPPDKPIAAVSIVRVCNSRDEYIGYGGSPSSGGYWYWVERELVFFDFRPRELTLAVLNHEAFHQFIFYFYGQLSPHSWYNEGHGDYFAGAKMTTTNRITGYGDAPGGIGRLQTIKEAARLLGEGKKGSQGAAVPLKQLMHFHQSDYYGGKGYDPGICYAQGWSVVHMLRESKSLLPRWELILPEYLVNLLAAREEVASELMKKTLADAEEAKPGSSAEMSKEVKDYYEKVDEGKVQDRAHDKTFAGWTDDDWSKFQRAWLAYVEKL